MSKINCQVRQASSNIDAKHYDTERGNGYVFDLSAVFQFFFHKIKLFFVILSPIIRIG